MTGAALLGGRSALIYAVGIGANVVLARLLGPRDFGLVAVGTVVLVLGLYLGEGGLGAALVRRKEPPSRRELEAVNALQLALTTGLAVVCVAAASQFGRDGAVVATMVAALPIWVLRAPSVIVLERELRFRTIATADVLEAVTYYLWAVVAVVLGFGVWGLATAVVVRAMVGTLTMIVLGPVGLVLPRWSWALLRPLVGFAAKFQTTAVVYIAREQGMNLAVAAVAGISTLGVWNLAWRILQIPNLLFTSVGRVAYPMMARLLGGGEDPRPMIERGAAALAALTGVVVVALVGFAQALPVLVGPGWDDVPAVLLWSGIALILGAPVTAATSGYLFAADAAGGVATAMLANAIVWLAIALPLLPQIGAPAVGVGLVAGSVVQCGLLWRRTVKRTGAALAPRIAGPTTAALLAAVSGWVLSDWSGETLLGSVAATVAAELVLLAGLAAVSRTTLRDTRLLVGQALVSVLRRGAPSGSAA